MQFESVCRKSRSSYIWCLGLNVSNSTFINFILFFFFLPSFVCSVDVTVAVGRNNLWFGSAKFLEMFSYPKHPKHTCCEHKHNYMRTAQCTQKNNNVNRATVGSRRYVHDTVRLTEYWASFVAIKGNIWEKKNDFSKFSIRIRDQVINEIMRKKWEKILTKFMGNDRSWIRNRTFANTDFVRVSLAQSCWNTVGFLSL